MLDLLQAAQEEALIKLASVTTIHLLTKPKAGQKGTKSEIVVNPTTGPADFWESPTGSYTRAATTGAGTGTALGLLAGQHWAGRVPLLESTESAVQRLRKLESDTGLRLRTRAKASRLFRGLAVAGALAGVSANALYRRAAAKQGVKPIVVHMPTTPESAKRSVKTAAAQRADEVLHSLEVTTWQR